VVTSIDGLASGLDTTAMINSLMAVEALPQTQLKTKLASDQSMITSLQGLNTRLTLLNSTASGDAALNAMNLFTASTTAASLTATAGTSAAAGSLDVTVTKLAQNQVAVTAAMTAWPVDGAGVPAKLTIVDSTGKATEIAPASTSLDDVVAAVNAAAGGATAVKVPAGNGTYRLQLTASIPGAAGVFTAYQGTAADVVAGTATDLMAAPGAAVVKTAQDAEAVLYSGTAAQQTVTSATNTFTGLLPGVSVTATAVSATPVTVTVASDTAGITQKASDLVKAVNDALQFISDNSAVTVTTGASGASAAKGGIFTGNSSIRAVSDDLLNAMAAPINGKSPSEYGISITRNGDFTFDKDKLASALAADPAGTSSAIQQIAARVAASTSNASDPVKGSVTALIAGQQSEAKDLTDQITSWDTRLAARRASLQAVYTNMEVLLGGLKSQSSWLAGQLAGLSSSSK
jgi:flagellar hook-associated protein 2